MRVYLADLGHNQLTFSSDIDPIGVANLAAYVSAYLKSPQPVHVRVFHEPQDLRGALDDVAPDVLALSSYAWNHELSRSFARYARRRVPGILTMLGGPNYPLTVAEMETFLRDMPEIDVAVRGPTYEAERAFLNVMQRLVDVDGARDGLFEAPVDGNDWIDPKTGAFVRGTPVARIDHLDEIPSPYRNGWMDDFYGTGYFPMLQIARGCPFTCQLQEFAFPSPQAFPTEVPDDVRRLILSRIDTFGEHPAGLGKFTRTMFSRDFRRRVIRGTSTASTTA